MRLIQLGLNHSGYFKRYPSQAIQLVRKSQLGRFGRLQKNHLFESTKLILQIVKTFFSLAQDTNMSAKNLCIIAVDKLNKWKPKTPAHTLNQEVPFSKG
jgi:hypothetical protein